MTPIEWLALSLLLILLELFAPGIYLVWFGLAGLIMAGILSFVPMELLGQLYCFSAVSAVTVFVGFYVYKVYLKKDKKTTEYPHLNDLAGQYIGKTVTVLSDVENGQTKVSVGDSEWVAETQVSFKAGDKAIVSGTKRGVILVLSRK